MELNSKCVARQNREVMQRKVILQFSDRNRWHNHLNPDINQNKGTEEEDYLIIEAHKNLGNRWSEFA